VGVIIGMDLHKCSATIEVVDERARMLAAGRYGTDKASYADVAPKLSAQVRVFATGAAGAGRRDKGVVG
jgi:hypothetical protein